MQAFVPKNRRPRFEFKLQIIDLNNIPLVSGTAFVKWRVPASSATEHNGQTDKAIIVDHRAQWNYEKALHVRLTIDKHHVLQECEVQFEVVQEFTSGPNGEKSVLGRIKLNLAEYVDKSDDEEGITRRYLMHDSKINSTLKLGVIMNQVEGDRSFSAPPLKSSAMVFGGIAGVVSAAEQADANDLGQMPSINTKSNETSDLQDIYRRTLAASWNSSIGDTPADSLIESLFSGNSNFQIGTQTNPSGRQVHDENEIFYYDPDSGRISSSDRLSPALEKQRKKSPSNSFLSEEGALSLPATSGRNIKRGSIQQRLYEGKVNKGQGRKSHSPSHELSEFDVRDDLRSWEVSSIE